MKMPMNLFANIYEGKKVLITGDTGFKGSWLSFWLLELGAHVFGYALPPKSNKVNYVQTGLNKFINHFDGDIRNRRQVENYFQKVKPDFAFHLAAQPLVLESYIHPHYTFNTNLMGTVNFFEAVRKTKSLKVALNITSDKCYKNNESKVGYKETDPMGGKDPYSASKACSELITFSYINSFFNEETSASVASVRSGNVLGGGDWAEYRIVPDFYRAFINGNRLVIRNPKSTRPWQHVLEPLNGYLLLASRLFLEGKKYQGGWNFGPDEEQVFKVEQLVQKLSALSGYTDFHIIESMDRLKESELLHLNTTKSKSLLGWKPVLDFEKTVELTHMGYLAQIKGLDIYQSRQSELDFYLRNYFNTK